MTADLVLWLTAQLDADEQAAREAADGDSGRWFMGDKWNVYRGEDEARLDEQYEGEEHRLVAFGNVKAQSEHIALYDPARAVAEAAAKRAIIAHVAAWRHKYLDEDAYFSCSQAVAPGDDGEPGSGCADDDRAGQPCDCGLQRRQIAILGPLAQVYEDRPGYRQEWAP